MFKALLNVLPRKEADLEAKLTGVNGYTGRGEIEFTAWKGGARVLEVELRGVAGRSADIHINDAFVMTVNFDNGRLDKTFSTRNGDTVPELAEGAQIVIRQNDEIILEGVLIPD